MICQIKTIKTRPAKTSAKATFVAPEHAVTVEPLFLAPYAAGPFVVPVSRWVE